MDNKNEANINNVLFEKHEINNPKDAATWIADLVTKTLIDQDL